MTNVVTNVVESDLCSGCGVCVAVCPHAALGMITALNGDLVARAVGDCCESCNLCLQVCPFVDGVHDPRQHNINLFSRKVQSSAAFHENIGWHRRCFAGFARVADHRSRAASGGLVTWCLDSLLNNGLVDKTSVVGLSPEADPPLFQFKTASSAQEIRCAAGSVYHPVEISGLLSEMMADPSARWALVGIPCLCAAVRTAAMKIPKIRGSLRYLLGLACGMLQNTMYTEFLLAKSGTVPAEVVEITYRKKRPHAPANDYGFCALDRGGRAGPLLPYLGLPYFLAKNAYFRYNACNYCKDAFAEAADACFMDAWLPEYMTDPRGTSLVVVRSQSVEELLLGGGTSGDLHLDTISAERVVLSQKGHVDRKQQLICIRLPGSHSTYQGKAWTYWKDRLDWWLQRRTQYRSKRVWSRYGRKYGRLAFWVAMADLLLAQTIRPFLQRLIRLPGRVARKVVTLLGMR